MRIRLFVSVLSICLFFSLGKVSAQRHTRSTARSVKVVKVQKGRKVRPTRVVTYKPAPRFSRTRVVVIRPRRVRTVTVLPMGYQTIVYRNNNYYYHGGLFYRHVNAAYTLIPPPIGIRIRVLPVGYQRIVMGGHPHFYYQGVYYTQVGEEYETTTPETGTFVASLPEENVDEVTIDGQTYYEYENYLYKSVTASNGSSGYEVVGQLDD